MPTPKIMIQFAAVAALAVSATALFAAEKPEHDTLTAPVMVAALDDALPSIGSVSVVDAHPSSAGVSESLPDLPGDLPGAPLSFYLFRLRAKMQSEQPEPSAAPESEMQQTVYDDTGSVSMLESSPLAPAAHRIRAERFNTEDGINTDFAICYRLTRRSSLEVIPGDPAPVKIPIATMANNMGVTVGMVLKLGHQR